MQIPAARVTDPSIYRLVFCMYLGHVSSGGKDIRERVRLENMIINRTCSRELSSVCSQLSGNLSWSISWGD